MVSAWRAWKLLSSSYTAWTRQGTNVLLCSCPRVPATVRSAHGEFGSPGRHIPHVAYLCPVHRVVVRRVLRLRLRLTLRLCLLCRLLLLLLLLQQLLLRLSARLRRPGSRPSSRNVRTPLPRGLPKQHMLLLLLLLL